MLLNECKVYGLQYINQRIMFFAILRNLFVGKKPTIRSNYSFPMFILYLNCCNGSNGDWKWFRDSHSTSLILQCLFLSEWARLSERCFCKNQMSNVIICQKSKFVLAQKWFHDCHLRKISYTTMVWTIIVCNNWKHRQFIGSL